MKLRISIILILILILSAQGCKNKAEKGVVIPKDKSISKNVFDPSKPISWGRQQTIYVFADPAVWVKIEPYLRYSMERKFYTVENEPLFDIVRGDLRKLDQFYKFKNLLFYCDLSSDDDVSEYVKKIINPQMKTYLAKNKAGLFANHNLWANDQFVVFAIGDNQKHLINYSSHKANTMFEGFKQKLVDRLQYQNEKSKPAKKSVFKGFPFTLTVPESYLTYKKDIPNRFISLIWRSRQNQEENPDKYIAVYYEKAEKDPVNREWLLKIRKKMAWTYYDQDEMDPDLLAYSKYNFNGYYGWTMSGPWKNKKYYIGGAFRSFGFYDPKTKTAYFIDNSVYFPAGFKLKYLLELEGLSQTLQIK